MHRLEKNILHHANKRREQRQMNQFKYKHIETDDEPNSNYYFNNLHEFLTEFNECLETNYKTLEDYNKGEPYRKIIKIY